MKKIALFFTILVGVHCGSSSDKKSPDAGTTDGSVADKVSDALPADTTVSDGLPADSATADAMPATDGPPRVAVSPPKLCGSANNGEENFVWCCPVGVDCKNMSPGFGIPAYPDHDFCDCATYPPAAGRTECSLRDPGLGNICGGT